MRDECWVSVPREGGTQRVGWRIWRPQTRTVGTWRVWQLTTVERRQMDRSPSIPVWVPESGRIIQELGGRVWKLTNWCTFLKPTLDSLQTSLCWERHENTNWSTNSCRLCKRSSEAAHVKLKIQTSEVWDLLQQGRIKWEGFFKTAQFVLIYFAL